MTSRTIRLDLLTSPGFCAALALLLLNDFVLKARFANWWTGKLSDVAGLAAFALCWAAVFPQARRVVFSVTALGFILWKSPLVTPALTWWNQFGIWPLQRVVDPTDDIALGILPLAYIYATTILQCTPRRSIFAAQLALLIGARTAATIAAASA